MIINKLIGDVFVSEVELDSDNYINDQHEDVPDYKITGVYDDSFNLITEYDEKLLRREIDAILRNEF